MQSGFSVFISHVTEDESIAIELKRFIEKIFLNSEVFVAGRDLTGGEVWVKEIREKLKSSRVIISLVTPFSEASPWVLFESGAGFSDSRTIPVCCDGIAVDRLRPPLKLLQARDISETGLQKLTCDIARRAEVREPSEYPGLHAALRLIEEFLQARRESHDAKKSVVTSAEPSTKIPTVLDNKTVDPEVQEKANFLKKRLKEVTIRSIENASKSFDVPSRNDMEQMTQQELREVCSCYNIPCPTGITTTLLLLQVDPIRIGASRWKKMNALKSIEDALQQVEKFERSL